MEMIANRASHRMGWSDAEEKLLWETAEEAQSKGLPLKAVFEHIADRTGRKPNSIRNYYYQQVRERDAGRPHAARFTPFTQHEVDDLMRQVLTATGQGQSVRACLSRISGGDHSRMLRYQNKYRSVIKSRPEYVQSIVDQLQSEGISCTAPSVNHRSRVELSDASANLTLSARRTGDAELVRACEALQRLMDGCAPDPSALISAAKGLIDPVKEFAARTGDEQHATLGAFVQTLVEHIGAFEAACAEIASPAAANA